MPEFKKTHHQDNRNQNVPDFKSQFRASWIETEIDTVCIKFAEDFGGYLAKNRLSTSQIRNIFGEIKRIQGDFAKNKSSFVLLKPKLAYAAKRANNIAVTEFKKILDLAHDAVKYKSPDDDKRFQRFCDFTEAILAYHKASGGN